MTRLRPLYAQRNQTLPELPARTALFVIAIDLIPALIGKLEIMRRTPVWVEETDEVTGDNLLGEQIMSLLQPITGLDDLYRLLDTNLRGTIYTTTTTDGVVEITPAIPVVPATTDAPLLPEVALLRETLSMLVAGATAYDTPLLTTMSLQSLLQAVIDAIAAGNTDASASLTELEAIAALLA
jgi:hypothetical protein